MVSDLPVYLHQMRDMVRLSEMGAASKPDRLAAWDTGVGYLVQTLVHPIGLAQVPARLVLAVSGTAPDAIALCSADLSVCSRSRGRWALVPRFQRVDVRPVRAHSPAGARGPRLAAGVPAELSVAAGVLAQELFRRLVR